MNNKTYHPDRLITGFTTILGAIRWGVSQFQAADVYFGHGTDNPLDEAVYLILHALNLPQYQELNEATLNIKLTAEQRVVVVDILLRRIKERKPAAYLTNVAYFSELEFYVDERVLIPRSPIAELIEKRFEPWVIAERVKRILDIGTGCGCFAIASSYVFPDAQIDAVDISSGALDVARINLAKHDLKEKVRLFQSDLFDEITKEKITGKIQSKYDVIISNPPYVSSSEMTNLPREYSHEPFLALAAGSDGLDIVERLLHEAKNHLNPNGILVVEVGNSAEILVEKYPRLPFIWLDFERGDSEVFLLNAMDL